MATRIASEFLSGEKRKSSIHPVMKRVSTLWAMEIERFHWWACRINDFIYTKLSVEGCIKFIVFSICNVVTILLYREYQKKKGKKKKVFELSTIYNRISQINWMIWRIIKFLSFVQFHIFLFKEFSFTTWDT